MSANGSGKIYSFDGFSGNLGQWSKRLGVPRTTLVYRIKKFGDSDGSLKMVFSPDRHNWMRAAKFVEHEGETHCLMEWARIAGISTEAFRQRLRKGYTMEEAMRKNPRYGHGGWTKKFGGKRIVIDGVEDSIAGHARRRGIKYSVVKERVQSGWNLNDAIITSKVKDKTPYIKASIRRRELASMGIIV